MRHLVCSSNDPYKLPTGSKIDPRLYCLATASLSGLFFGLLPSSLTKYLAVPSLARLHCPRLWCFWVLFPLPRSSFCMFIQLLLSSTHAFRLRSKVTSSFRSSLTLSSGFLSHLYKALLHSLSHCTQIYLLTWLLPLSRLEQFVKLGPCVTYLCILRE